MRCRNRGTSNPMSLFSIWLLLMATVLGLSSCTQNASSSSGTQSGSGGTGNFEGHWVVGVAPAQSNMFQSVASTSSDIPATLSTTTVMITVTDPSGTPAPPIPPFSSPAPTGPSVSGSEPPAAGTITGSRLPRTIGF